MFRIRLIALGWLSATAGLGAGMSAHAEPATTPAGELGQLDELYAGLLPWVARLYDPASGGFYETLGLKQDREDRPYAPDIQSTHFAVNLFRDNGLLETMPSPVHEGLVRYFQSRELPDGYFADPDYPEMRQSVRTMGRALIFARGSLASLRATVSRSGAEQADTPKGNDKVNTNKEPPEAGTTAPLPAHIATVEAFREWLDARPWDNAWTSLDNLASQDRLIRSQAPALREALTDEALRNVNARMDPQTGLIGGGSLIVRISGAFKLAMFCKTLERPVPGAEVLWNTVLGWYRSGPKTDKIFLIRNPAELLAMLSRASGRTLTDEELAMVLAVSRTELARYRQADGGFSSFDGKYYIGPNDLYMQPRIPAKAGPQGDMNGTASAWVLRQSLYRLAGAKAPRLAAPPDYWERF
jgi:hypothetical protein